MSWEKIADRVANYVYLYPLVLCFYISILVYILLLPKWYLDFVMTYASCLALLHTASCHISGMVTTCFVRHCLGNIYPWEKRVRLYVIVDTFRSIGSWQSHVTVMDYHLMSQHIAKVPIWNYMCKMCVVSNRQLDKNDLRQKLILPLIWTSPSWVVVKSTFNVPKVYYIDHNFLLRCFMSTDSLKMFCFGK